MGMVLAYAMLAFAFNIIGYQYGRGVTRAALDEGVHVGSRAEATEADCLAKVKKVLDESMGARFRAQIDDSDMTCKFEGTRVRARAVYRFEPFFASFGDITVPLTAVSRKEVAP